MFTKETIPAEIPVLKDYADYLCYNCIPADKPASQMSLEELHQDQPSWDIASMIRGLNRLSEIAADGPCLYNVYTPDESSDCPEKKMSKSGSCRQKEHLHQKAPGSSPVPAALIPASAPLWNPFPQLRALMN